MIDWEIHRDRARIDRDRAFEWISKDSYWAENIPRATFERSCDGSLCFAACDPESGEQVGFARVITDGATFAYLCDVIVDPGRRGVGIGKALVGGVVRYLEPLNLRRWSLATRDAHSLYESFGFERSPVGSEMEKKFSDVYRTTR